MCDIWKYPADGLPLSDIERIFSDPFYHKLERVILAGGEPSIRQDLVEVASFFINQLPRLRAMALLTNGYSTDKIVDSVNRILDIMDNSQNKGQYLAVQIALDDIGEAYNKIRGIKKAWKQTDETIKQLKQLSLQRPNLGLMLHVVMQPDNLDHLDKIDQFAHDHEVPVLFSPAVVSETYFGNTEQETSLAFSPSEKERVREFLLAHNESYTDALSFYYKDIANMLQGAPRSRNCMMGYHIMYVRMDGLAFPCLNSGDEPLGDLKTQSPREVWRGKGPDEKRREVRQNYCPTCPSACDNDINGTRELIVKVKEKLFSKGG
jgi:MoaA/NifB/PqqE/SkfB family radical SAM enzyme